MGIPPADLKENAEQAMKNFIFNDATMKDLSQMLTL
jgi:hypothetical protein